jgi:regulator of replication initiation timing
LNTDQAYALLIEAGVTEDISIQTVRRWFRERKISYKGSGHATGYILDNTDQAFHLLKDAGVADSTAVQIVRRLVRDGKIERVGTGIQKPTYKSSVEDPKQTSKRPVDQEMTIRQLKVKIKAQDEHIKGIEHLHQTSIARLIQQIDILKKDIVNLGKEKSELQSETKKLLKENIGLTNELIKLKGKLFQGNNSSSDKTDDVPFLQPKTNDYRQKLGLSKMASDKEVLTRYKKLLKITHPDHGGNATIFHFIKTDYDQFRNSINMK